MERDSTFYHNNVIPHTHVLVKSAKNCSVTRCCQPPNHGGFWACLLCARADHHFFSRFASRIKVSPRSIFTLEYPPMQFLSRGTCNFLPQNVPERSTPARHSACFAVYTPRKHPAFITPLSATKSGRLSLRLGESAANP